MKVIAFSLWGYDPKYCIGAIKNANLASILYPEWVCKFYYGKNTDLDCIKQLSTFKNVELIPMSEEGNWTGMFWRFCAADSEDVVISRDTDSRLSLREAEAVQEWLDSPYDFHIMRDHPYHKTEILGGMWGARNGILNGISKKIEEYNKGNFWQVDQNFLREHIYSNVKNNTCVHDSCFKIEPNTKQFPTKRIDYEFVGEVYDHEDQRHPDHYQIIKHYEQN
jgi:hypothetical protein